MKAFCSKFLFLEISFRSIHPFCDIINDSTHQQRGVGLSKKNHTVSTNDSILYDTDTPFTFCGVIPYTAVIKCIFDARQIGFLSVALVGQKSTIQIRTDRMIKVFGWRHARCEPKQRNGAINKKPVHSQLKVCIKKSWITYRHAYCIKWKRLFPRPPLSHSARHFLWLWFKLRQSSINLIKYSWQLWLHVCYIKHQIEIY